MDVHESIKLSAESCLPSPSNKKSPTKKSSILRWNEDFQPFKENAMFWHSIWLSAGRPINTVLHQIMEKDEKSLSLSDTEKQKNGRMY